MFRRPHKLRPSKPLVTRKNEVHPLFFSSKLELRKEPELEPELEPKRSRGHSQGPAPRRAQQQSSRKGPGMPGMPGAVAVSRCRGVLGCCPTERQGPDAGARVSESSGMRGRTGFCLDALLPGTRPIPLFQPACHQTTVDCGHPASRAAFLFTRYG
jgi:hypothetical protein